MNNNRIKASDMKPTRSSANPGRRLCGCSRSAKIMWLAASIIALATTATVFVILSSLRKTNANNSSMAENTTKALLIEWTHSPVITEPAMNSQAPTTQTSTTTTTSRSQLLSNATNSKPLKWKKHATTVAGGKGVGSALDQLNDPCTVYVYDDEQMLLLNDRENHRILEWKFGATEGKVVAGGNGPGLGIRQLDNPKDAILNHKRNLVIVCDLQNRRIMGWPRQKRSDPYLVIANIVCFGLALNSNGDLYVVDWDAGEVRRWKEGEQTGTLVAGGHGVGIGTNQLRFPTYIIVDEDESVYVVDGGNKRMMKWTKGATEGIEAVAMQLLGSNFPVTAVIGSITFDRAGHVYASSAVQHVIVRLYSDSPEYEVVAGRDQFGNASDQLRFPEGLAFDKHGNLYVADQRNNRVQKFVVDPS